MSQASCLSVGTCPSPSPPRACSQSQRLVSTGHPSASASWAQSPSYPALPAEPGSSFSFHLRIPSGPSPSGIVCDGQRWKRPKCPGRMTDNVRSVQTLGDFSALKRKDVLTPAPTWMSPEDIMLSERVRHRRTKTAWFHSCEVPRGVRVIDRESRRWSPGTEFPFGTMRKFWRWWRWWL